MPPSVCAPRSLVDDLLLLAPRARGKHLRVAVRAAAQAEGKPTTLRRARRSLVARGLASPSGRRAWTPTPAAQLDALHTHVSLVLWRPRRATARDLDLVAVLLAAGVLTGRQRMHARTLLAPIDPSAAPPAIAWLLNRYAVSTTAELADTMLRETSQRRTSDGGASNPGESDGIWAA
jgi:hypothetical protein